MIKKIVLTGGPCAGKTTALSKLEQVLTERGYKVLIVSESATELIKGGIRPFGDKSISMYDFQDVIINYQLDKEKSYDRALEYFKDMDVVIIYDRGVIDNKAYVSNEDFERLLSKNNLTELSLMDNYDMVIHLVTAALGKEEFYTLENNKARTETVEEAISQDKRTLNAWIGHRNLKVIDNSTDFEEKLNRVTDEVSNLLGNPITTRTQNKYIVSVDLDTLESNTNIEIENHYIRKTDDYERRLRKRTLNNESTYYLTVQKKDNSGKSIIVIDKKLTLKEYERLLGTSDIESSIKKNRYSFIYDKQYFRLDDFQDGLLLLEINLTDKEVKLPDNIKIIEDVTNNPKYNNYNLSKKHSKKLEVI